jgi:hypothetical protein
MHFYFLIRGVQEIFTGGDLSNLTEKRQERSSREVQRRLEVLESEGINGGATGMEARSLRLLEMQRRLRNTIVQCQSQAGIAAPESLRFIRDESR